VIPASVAPAARDVTPRLRSQADAARAAQRETLALAQADARLLAAQGNIPGAIQRINTGLATQTERTRQVIAVETQLARLQAQQARTGAGGSPILPRTIAGLSDSAAAVASAAGIGLGAAAMVQGAVSAGRYATGLTQTENVLRQLSGSQDRYNTLTRIAAENQKLFGGTLAENYAPLTGVLALSNQTGASLTQLNSVTQLLLAKAPGKSAGDAFFGLGEFLSGKGAEAALSLADQFNLSKAAIAALAAEGVSAEDRLTGLTQLLAEQGVTAATLQARLTEDSLAYNRLGASGEQAYIRLGKAANAVGVPLANFVAGGLEGFSTLVDRGKELAAVGGEVLASAGSYEQYSQIVQAQNAAMAQQWNLFGQQLPVLTREQYAYAMALQATGVAAEEANRRARGEVAAGTLDNSPEMQAAQRQQAGIRAIGQIAADANPEVQGLADRLLTLAAAGGPVGDGALALATSYANWGVSTQQVQITLDALEGTLQRQRDASAGAAAGTERASASMDLATAAANAQKAALGDATAAAAEQANAGGDMEAQARAAADALIAAGNAGAAAAALLAGSTGQVDQMTAALVRLEGAQARTRASGREGGLMGGGDTSGITQAQRDRLAAEEAARFRVGVEEDITRATGTTAQRLAQVNAELAKASPLSADRRRLLVDQAQLEQQLQREQESAADRASSKADSAAKKAASEAKQAAEKEQREREQRQNEVDRALERIEDRTTDHYRRLRQAQEDYTLSASRREEDYQTERQRLLAEGRVFEAQQLTERFQLEQRRAQEDAARARDRQTQDYGGDLAKIREDARLGGTEVARARAAVPATSAADVQRQAQAEAVLAATAGQRPTMPIRLQVAIAPTSAQIDGQTFVTFTWPLFEQLVDLELAESIATVALTAPPGGGQGGGVGGPRP
jgi:hypothetical protein